MKQLELNLQKRLLIVEPYDLDIEEDKVIISLGDSERYIENLLDEKRELNLICKGSDFSEQVAKLLVEFGSYINTYKNYITNDSKKSNQKHKALESFISAIEANGFYWSKNPYNKPADKLRLSQFPYERFTYKNQLIRFNNAESRTFNPEKCIIFEIL